MKTTENNESLYDITLFNFNLNWYNGLVLELLTIDLYSEKFECRSLFSINSGGKHFLYVDLFFFEFKVFDNSERVTKHNVDRLIQIKE